METLNIIAGVIVTGVLILLAITIIKGIRKYVINKEKIVGAKYAIER